MKYAFSNKAVKNKEVALITFVESEDAIVRTPEKRTVIEIGIGKREEMTRRKLVTTVRKMVTAAKAAKKKEIAFEFTDLVFPHLEISSVELAELIATNLEMANFEFVKYKTKPKEGWNTLTDVTIAGKLDAEVEKGFKKGKLVGEGVNGARSLANTPGGDMTPSKLADAAFEMAAGLPIAVTVIDEAGMEALGMGAILGVGKGSDDKPKFIIMEYMMGGEKEKPIVLVGKGITFDTGGLNLKPILTLLHTTLLVSIVSTVMRKLTLTKQTLGEPVHAK